MPVFMLPVAVYAHQATQVKEVHDAPAVRGGPIANMLLQHDNPSRSILMTPTTFIYTQTSNLNKEAIASYDWAENARKDEVKFQLSLAFPLWRGILGPNSVLGAYYTQKSGGNCPIAKSLHRFVKPTRTAIVPRFCHQLPVCRLDAARCGDGYNHDPRRRSDRPPAAGTAFILA
ncbi:phospholipase A [Shigella flexneri]